MALAAGVGIGFSLQRPNPQEPLLQANLYMQNSAEFRAACLQTYGWAEAMLQLKVRAFRSEMARTPGAKKPAIIMDLDETVLDNGSFQAYLDREGKAYSEADWQRYEQTPSDVRLIPGAKQFVEQAERLGVEVVYISNRWAKNRSFTVEALRLLQISTANIENRLLLREEGSSSNKTERRAKAAEGRQILMLLGDNLRDLSEEFAVPSIKNPSDIGEVRAAISNRAKAVDSRIDKWGSEWIIIPNPVYGEYDKLKGSDPHQLLRPSSLK